MTKKGNLNSSSNNNNKTNKIDKRIIYGIILPLIIIFVLIFLSGSNIGFKTNIEFAKEIDSNDFLSQNIEIKIGTLNIQNDFFIPRSVNIDKYYVCFNDLQNNNYIYFDLIYRKDKITQKFDSYNSNSYEIGPYGNDNLDIYINSQSKPMMIDQKNDDETYLNQFKSKSLWVVEAKENEYYVDCHNLNYYDQKYEVVIN